MLKRIQINKIDLVNIIIIFLFVFISCLFLNSISPLYDLYKLDGDVAIYGMCGRVMAAGGKLYKDIFDHKGINLYFVYYIGCLLGNEFLFAFLFEIFLITVSLVFIYKIFLIFQNQSKSLVSTILFLFIQIIILGGGLSGLVDSDFLNGPSTYSLPFINYGIYRFIKYKIKNIEIPNFIFGVLVSIIFFLKSNICIYFVLIYIFVLIDYLKEHNFKKIVFSIIKFILGFLIAFLIPLIYLLSNKILSDFIECYIIFNGKYATKNHNIFDPFVFFINLYGKSIHFKAHFSMFITVLMISFLYVINNKNFSSSLKKIYIVSFFLCIYFLNLSGRTYNNYFVSMTVFIIPLILYFVNNANEKKILLFLSILQIVLSNIIFKQDENVNRNKYLLCRWLSNNEIFKQNRNNLYIADVGSEIYLPLNITSKLKYNYCLSIKPQSKIKKEYSNQTLDATDPNSNSCYAIVINPDLEIKGVEENLIKYYDLIYEENDSLFPKDYQIYILKNEYRER